MGSLIRLGFVFMILATLLVGSGCKEAAAPRTDLEVFVEEMGALEGQAQDDSLRALAAGPLPGSKFANYMIGNGFYKAATDSAQLVGWSGGAVNALLDSAETYFTLAVEQDSTFIEAMVNLGSLWDDRADQMGNRQQRNARLAKSEEFYRLALSIDPDDEKARCNLGGLYMRMQQTSKAMAEFKIVLESHPESALAHYNLAIMFAEAEIYREAIHEWETASELDPDGDIGQRSRDNVRIVKELLESPTPAVVQ